MKTEVVMKRPLFGVDISQQSKSEFLSATDLVKAGNRWRALQGLSLFDLTEWFRNKRTVEFMAELELKYGKVKISGKGRGKHTWVHPFLFIDLALAISPKLKIETYEWLYDHLLHYRNTSGDSFKKMSGALYHNISNKKEYHELIQDTSRKIKAACGIEDWKDWQKASQETLEKRNKIQENISLLCDVLPIEEAIRIGILKG